RARARPLYGTEYDLRALIYDACANLPSGPPPPVIDELELWQIAAILGKNRAPEEIEEAAGLTFNQRRAAQLELERPEWMTDGGFIDDADLMILAQRSGAVVNDGG